MLLSAIFGAARALPGREPMVVDDSPPEPPSPGRLLGAAMIRVSSSSARSLSTGEELAASHLKCLRGIIIDSAVHVRPSPDTLNTMATRSSVGISAIVVAGDGRTETLLLAALIVFAGYTAFGVTGFGASPITVPVLAHFLPLPFVLTLAAALDLGSSVALGLHTKTAPVARTVGTDRIVDELIYRCTHTIEMPWILPGVRPTGRRIEFAVIVVVQFEDGKIACERIYWDQASVLAQAGLLDAGQLPVTGSEAARKVLDPTREPSNALIERAS